MGEEPTNTTDEEQMPEDEQTSEAQTDHSEQSADSSNQAAGDAGTDTEQLSEELAKNKDQLLRTLAEMENVRRRAVRDVENAHKFALEKLLADLLPVIDSLEKAEETARASDESGAMAEGVALSLKLFLTTLGKAGVEQIDPLGAPFDPQQHEAMAMVPNPNAEPNSVMDVLQRGYVLNGRLVRAAKVVVAKGSDTTD